MLPCVTIGAGYSSTTAARLCVCDSSPVPVTGADGVNVAGLIDPLWDTTPDADRDIDMVSETVADGVGVGGGVRVAVTDVEVEIDFDGVGGGVIVMLRETSWVFVGEAVDDRESVIRTDGDIRAVIVDDASEVAEKVAIVRVSSNVWLSVKSVVTDFVPKEGVFEEDCDGEALVSVSVLVSSPVSDADRDVVNVADSSAVEVALIVSDRVSESVGDRETVRSAVTDAELDLSAVSDNDPVGVMGSSFVTDVYVSVNSPLSDAVCVRDEEPDLDRVSSSVGDAENVNERVGVGGGVIVIERVGNSVREYEIDCEADTSFVVDEVQLNEVELDGLTRCSVSVTEPPVFVPEAVRSGVIDLVWPRVKETDSDTVSSNVGE
jgi:hypothetical protein